MPTIELVTLGMLILGTVLLLLSFPIQRHYMPDDASAKIRKSWKYPNIFICFFLACYFLQAGLLILGYPAGYMLLASIVFFFGAVFVVVVARLSSGFLLKLSEADIEKSSIQIDSHRHQLEAVQSKKLAAVGQLTGSLAHDFNNLLSIVVGNLDEIREELPSELPEVEVRLDAALTATLAGIKVTRALLAVARREKNQIQTYNLNELILDIMPLINSSAGSTVTVRAQLVDNALICRLNASGLDNVILNLVINARDAMRNLTGDQVLTLRTNNVNIQDDFDDRLPPGWYALVEVSDTGTGMSQAVLAQVFEPFFTTKGRDEGTGLGLSTVYRFLEEAGGAALIESTEGIGTAVRLYIPLEKIEGDVPTHSESQRIEFSRSHNILIAEPDGEFDLLAAEAARICRAPIALISVMDESERCLKASVGLDPMDLPRDDTFFSYVLRHTKGVLVVPDASLDPRFSENPIETAAGSVQFYAAAPLVNGDGVAVGVICVIDHVPRTLLDWQTVQLEELARRAMGVKNRIQKMSPAQELPPIDTDTDIDAPGLSLNSVDLFNVLVVDDEVDLCELSAIWLTSIGYKVTTANGPAEALEYLAKENYSILFTDIVMPGDMDGVELARKAMLLQPLLRVLLTSGYAERLLEDEDLPGELISKPYRKTDLVNAISCL